MLFCGYSIASERSRYLSDSVKWVKVKISSAFTGPFDALIDIHLTSCSVRVPSKRWHTNRLSSEWFSSLVSKRSYHSYYCHPNWLLQLHFIRLDGFIAIGADCKIYLLLHRVDFASHVPESICIHHLCPSQNCTHTEIHLRKRPARAVPFPISWPRTDTGVRPDSIEHLQMHDPASIHH